MALIILLENLVKALDDGNCAVGIFLDFQKTFDTVDHCILLDKHHIYGIRGIAYDCFSSYLINRFQSVLYINFESDYKEIKCGVPEGSILGPLLFLIDIHDLPSVSKFFSSILFAEDTIFSVLAMTLDAIVKEINVEINIKIYSWVKANKLSLNVDKTNFKLFTPKCFPRNMNEFQINGSRISEVNETKFLGVIIDNKLKWPPHIMYISKKLQRALALSWRLEKFLTMKHFLPCTMHSFIHI